MDRNRNVRTVCAAPYSESGLDGTFSKRKVYHPASCADGSGTACAVLLSGGYAERDPPLTSCFRFSGHPGGEYHSQEVSIWCLPIGDLYGCPSIWEYTGIW